MCVFALQGTVSNFAIIMVDMKVCIDIHYGGYESVFTYIMVDMKVCLTHIMVDMKVYLHTLWWI